MNLPALNAVLNGTSAVLLAAGWVLIRRGRKRAHKRTMIAAFAVSCAFLVSYLVYHYTAGVTHFQGAGAIRAVYLSVLASHTILAAAVPFLAVATLWRGLKSRFDAHRRIARWALPIWLYVSVTGVAVYWMLYHR